MTPKPVTAAIKVCALDTPLLPLIVPHMLKQARYPFAETLLVADPRTDFSGKYARRSRVTRAEYEGTLASLVAAGHVDRVVWAEPEPAKVASLFERYFEEQVSVRWTHDMTGAPVFSALLGLEAAQHDLVVLFDADMLFHSSGTSWVAEGVQVLQELPSAWLVMTHAGPPAGPLGAPESLGLRNQVGAWDAERRLWLFHHASSRYFLTDRRHLRGTIPAVYEKGQLEPLERCLSVALRARGAHRVNLAREGSWDLHVEDHGPPFPAWCRHVIALVERGLVPKQQLGHYDLNLRRAAQRRPWQALIQGEFPEGTAMARM